jgi:acetyl esterase/lipase
MNTIRCFTFLSSLGLVALAVRAQSIEEILLRPPLATDTPPATEEIVYRFNNLDDRGFNRIAQKITVPTLTVYHPAKAAHRGAAIVVCPGGAYTYVAFDREGFALGRYFSERGLTVAVLKYRLPDPKATPEGLPYSQQDGLAAVQLVRSHAREWGIDPTRIGILGCSAGGHLAGSVGILGDEAAGSRPDFVALLYPVVCMDGPSGRDAHAGADRRIFARDTRPNRPATVLPRSCFG